MISNNTCLPSTSSECATDFVDCTICGKTFSRRGINIHLARSHTDSLDSILINEEEEVSFTSNNDDEKHLSSLGKQICKYCGKTFKCVKIHMSKHIPLNIMKLLYKHITKMK